MDDSDDSDFYGDDETVLSLCSKVDDFSIPKWWSLQASNKHAPPQLQLRRRKTAVDMAHLHNPYAGVAYAWQLTETVDNFLARLPPATTEGVPWIYTCNPYIQRKSKAESTSQKATGCEDEGPEDDSSDLATLMEGGMERLHMISQFASQLQKSGKPQALMENEMRKAGFDGAQDILGLAHHLHVRCGKWMIFCSTLEVNEAWAVVAKATVNNQLGIAAKVAPKSTMDNREERLICVYTADFNDKQDVKRVASSLKQLGLIRALDKPICYKPDAYTYLGISSRNPWGLRASIYDSSTVLSKW